MRIALRLSSFCTVSILSLMATAAPQRPRHDIWIEGESCTDHDFSTIGRDPVFSGCYGKAILQLQTRKPCPPGGYYATFHPILPEAGWWELWLATTQPRDSRLCAYHVQITGYHSRRLNDVPIRDTYGPGEIFGWVKAGMFRLPKGRNSVTLRCDERRRSENDYLLYIDALVLRRAAPPGPGRCAWIAGPEAARMWQFSCEFRSAAEARQVLVNVLCDGTARVEFDGRDLGTASGTDAPARLFAPDLRKGPHRLRIRVVPGTPGALMVWVDAAGEVGGRRFLSATGDGNWRIEHADGSTAVPRRLGGMRMPPYGDMTVQAPPRFPLTGMRIPVKTGNLSVDCIIAAAKGESPPAPRAHPEFDAWKTYGGVSSVEDYICWLPLEPERGRWNWAYYDNNCRELRRRGMSYTVYPWLHFTPKWALESELWDPLLCLRHGESTWGPSIWSPKTLMLFDRFYRALHEHFGNRISGIYVSMIADYGEIGYPIGMTQRLVPTDHIHPGFWCGDRNARADFRRFALDKYGTLAGINRAWATDFTTPESIDFAQWAYRGGYTFAATEARRRRLDFADWYLGAMVDFVGRAVAVSRRYFPRTPHEIKIGFGSERLEFGSDITAYVKRSKIDAYTVRSTHGKLPMYFYRRFSTAAKFYGVPLVTEPPGGVSRNEEVERIFKDATCGTTEYFDYPANLLGASDLFGRFGFYMEGKHSLTDIAFFHPTTDHLLRPAQDNPPVLLAACAAARDYFDWDLVDERLVRDGALDSYRVLLWPDGTVVPRRVFERIHAWVRHGGVLIRAAVGAIEAVNGVPLAGAKFLCPSRNLPSARELWRFDVPSRDKWYVDVGAPDDGAALAGDWGRRESGHWEWGGRPNGVTKRWSGPRPLFVLPVDPKARYRLKVSVARHPKLLDETCTILVNGRPVEEVPHERTAEIRLTLTPAEWQGRPTGEIGFVHRPWRPCDIDKSSDTRTLGIAVAWLKLWRAGTPEPTVPNARSIHRTIHLTTVAQQCRRHVGTGWTVLLPFRGTADMPDFARAVSAIVHRPAAVIPEYRGPAVADGDRDDVWTALLSNRVLLLNRSDSTIDKVIPFDPGNFAAFGVEAAGPLRRIRVRLAPHTLASVELPSGRVLRP